MVEGVPNGNIVLGEVIVGGYFGRRGVGSAGMKWQKSNGEERLMYERMVGTRESTWQEVSGTGAAKVNSHAGGKLDGFIRRGDGAISRNKWGGAKYSGATTSQVNSIFLDPPL